MNFTLFNPNSPGTKFNDTTDNLILGCESIITKKTDEYGEYKDLRIEMENNGLSTDSYLRNIFKFLKYSGIVDYESGHPIHYINFFTELGKNYIRVLKTTQETLSNTTITIQQKETILRELENIKNTIILECIGNILKSRDCDYAICFKYAINFLIRYKHINEKEFAYLLYKMQKNEAQPITNLDVDITNYKNGTIDFEFIAKKQKSGETKSKDANEKKIPSYTYFMDNLAAAGICIKDDTRKPEYTYLEKNSNIIKETIGELL